MHNYPCLGGDKGGGAGIRHQPHKFHMHLTPIMSICSLVPRPHPRGGKRVWYTSSAFWGTQDAASHMIDQSALRINFHNFV